MRVIATKPSQMDVVDGLIAFAELVLAGCEKGVIKSAAIVTFGEEQCEMDSLAELARAVLANANKHLNRRP